MRRKQGILCPADPHHRQGSQVEVDDWGTVRDTVGGDVLICFVVCIKREMEENSRRNVVYEGLIRLLFCSGHVWESQLLNDSQNRSNSLGCGRSIDIDWQTFFAISLLIFWALVFVVVGREEETIDILNFLNLRRSSVPSSLSTCTKMTRLMRWDML